MKDCTVLFFSILLWFGSAALKPRKGKSLRAFRWVRFSFFTLRSFKMKFGARLKVNSAAGFTFFGLEF